MIQPKVYKLKQEFFKENSIERHTWERRKDELLEWLYNFYDYEIIDGHPLLIRINEVYGEYQPLPKKLPVQDELNAQKKKDYEEFVIQALGTEFKPNSKSKIAREAMDAFSRRKYGHTNTKAVVNRYVKEPFNTHGETNDHRLWVYYSTYIPLEEKVVEEWREILVQEHISEREAANAFYRQEQGEDISKEKQYYKNAV